LNIFNEIIRTKWRAGYEFGSDGFDAGRDFNLGRMLERITTRRKNNGHTGGKSNVVGDTITQQSIRNPTNGGLGIAQETRDL
jgi:hypothetical protein